MTGNCDLCIPIPDEGRLTTWADITLILHILVESANS